MDQQVHLILGATRSGKSLAPDLAKLLLSGELRIVDPKMSATRLSIGKAKARLMAAGVRPALAGRIAHSVAGHLLQCFVLRAAMLHHKRHAKDWFPWDVLVQPPGK